MADKKISALTAASTPLGGTEVLPIVQSGATVKVSAANITAGRAVSMASLSAVGNGAAGTQTLATFNAAADAFSNSVELALEPLISGQTRTGIGAQREGVGTGAAVYLTAGGNEVLRGTVAGNISVATGNVVMATAGKGIDFSANANAPGMTSELLNWYEEGTFTPTFTGFTVGDGSVFGFYRRIGKQVFVTYGFILGSTSAVGSLTGLSGLPFTTGTVGGSRFFNATGVAFKQGVGGFPAYALLYSASTTGSGPASTNTNTGMSATAPFVWATDDSLSFTATYFVD